MRKQTCLALYLVGGTLLLCHSGLKAQTPLGSLVGTVRDTAGAVVPEAVITLTHENKGFTRTVKADSSGNYIADLLPQGSFTVSCEKQGFKKFVQSKIPLRDGETLRIDVLLQVGDVTQSVTVSEAAPVVPTETGEVVSNGSGRQQFKYELVQPGGFAVNYAANGQYSAVTFMGKVAGSPGQQSASRYDGLDLYQMNPPMTSDFIQEIKISYAGAGADAEAPMVVSATTRGGTNELHGKVDGLFTNPALNSLGPQGSSSSRHGQTTARSYYYQIAGPVYIPKIYNGKNKTFWWLGITKQQSLLPYTGIPPRQVPPLAWRTGDFSKAPASAFNNGVGILKDPLTGQPFPNNQIPASRLDPVGVNISKYYPTPNYGGGVADPNNYVGLNQLTSGTVNGGNTYSAGTSWVHEIKIDEILTKNDTIGFSFLRNNGAFGWDFSDIGAWGITQANLNGMYYGYWTHTFSPAIVNELRFGYSSFGGGWGTIRAGGTTYAPLGNNFTFNKGGYEMLSALGVQWKPNNITGSAGDTLGVFCLGGTMWIPFCGTGGNETTATTPRAIWNWVDNLTIRHGSHSFKMGGEFYWKKDDGHVTQVFGYWNYDGRFSGIPYADLLLGFPSTTQNVPEPPKLSLRDKRFAGYFMDSWKVTPRLTLELGLRFEDFASPYEANGYDVNWNPATGAVIVRNQAALARVDPNYPKNIPIQTAAQAGYPSQLAKMLQPMFYPRLGWAYRPFNDAKTVVRGGFGVFPVGPQETGTLAPTYFTGQIMNPWVLNQTFTNAITNGTPLLTNANPFPTTPGQAPAQVAFGRIPNFPIPYTLNWSIGIERQIMANTGVRIAYIGSKGTQLSYEINVNAPAAGTLPYNNGCASQPVGTCVGPNYANFTNALLSTAGGNSIYHGLELEMHRRWSAGLEFMVDYFWSRSLQDTQDPGILAVFNGNDDFGSPIENPHNRARDRGLANGSLGQRLVVTHVWNLPLGKGMRWLNGSTLLDHVLGHWILLGRWQASSAPPYTAVWSGVDFTNTNTFQGRANVTPGCQYNLSSKSVASIWNPSCFTLPAAGTYGDVGTNTIYGVAPGVWSNTQVNLFKEFVLLKLPHMSEGARFRVGASMTNPINHPYLQPFTTSAIWNSSPALQVNSPTAGQGYITGTRSVSLTARVEF